MLVTQRRVVDMLKPDTKQSLNPVL